jgi:hypothetical protein
MQKLKDRVDEEKDEDIKRELRKGDIVQKTHLIIKNAIILNSLLKFFSNNEWRDILFYEFSDS